MFRRKAILGALRVTQVNYGSHVVQGQQHKCSLIRPRHHSTKPPQNPDDPDITRIFAAPKEDLVRDVYLSESGEEILTIDADTVLDETFDWADFERRFGLDGPEEPEDDAWEQLQTKFNMKSEKFDEKISSKANGNDPPKAFRGPGFSVQYCDEEPPEANYDTPQIQKKLNPTGEAGPLQYAAMEQQAVVEGQMPIPEEVKAGLFRNSDAFQQPKNRKRPGYERRVMSMESEMEKIAVDVLCNENSPWYTEGADIERVLLSPNMKNLTVYYNLEKGSSRPSSWWRKVNAKAASSVRASFAERLETKYVPRVYFEDATKEKDSKDPISEKSQLDMLFDQISAERTENSGANKELDAK